MMPYPSFARIAGRLGSHLVCRPTPRRRSAGCLVVELLEDRVVPATFTVRNPHDAGAGSLRQAILNAEATAATLDTIVFSASMANKTINLMTRGGTDFGPNALQVTTPIKIVGSNQTIARGAVAGSSAMAATSSAAA